MGEDRDTRMPKGEGPSARNAGQAKLLAGRIVSVIGILFALGGFIGAIFGGAANISAGAVGAALGVLGYFLGSRRLGTTAIIVSVAALFFVLAASQGLIPGIGASDHSLPGSTPTLKH